MEQQVEEVEELPRPLVEIFKQKKRRAAPIDDPEGKNTNIHYV